MQASVEREHQGSLNTKCHRMNTGHFRVWGVVFKKISEITDIIIAGSTRLPSLSCILPQRHDGRQRLSQPLYSERFSHNPDESCLYRLFNASLSLSPLYASQCPSSKTPNAHQYILQPLPLLVTALHPLSAHLTHSP